MPKGICAYCQNPLDIPSKYGYHADCASAVYKESQEQLDKDFPHVVVGLDGAEIDRFKTDDLANGYWDNIRYSKIVDKSK